MAKTRMISDLLAESGYQCGYFGLWGLGDDAKPQHGFRAWDTQAGSPAARAVQFLQQQKADQPFFLVASFPAVSAPYEGLEQKHLDMYASSRFTGHGWLPASARAADGKEYLKDIPASLRRCAAAVTAFDEEAGLLLAALDSRKLRDSTVVVFTSAAGHLMGRHGLWGAGAATNPINMYEESVLTPMIWRWPGEIPVQGVRPELVGGDDLFASLCELAGVKPPAASVMGSRSYLAVVKNKPLPKKSPWRNLLFSEAGSTEMARSPRFKLILREGGKGPNELYNLQKDPRELSNEYDNAEYASIRTELTRNIEQWRKEAG
jgi:arylsulfatase A-like enzyme